MRFLRFLVRRGLPTTRGVTRSGGALFPVFSFPLILVVRQRVQGLFRTTARAPVLVRWQSDIEAVWCWKQRSCRDFASVIEGVTPLRISPLRGQGLLFRWRQGVRDGGPKNLQ